LSLLWLIVCGPAGAGPAVSPGVGSSTSPGVTVYAIRGFGGAVFSRGMATLCDELESVPNVTCNADDYYSEADIVQKATAAVAAGQTVVLVGHSWGAHAALRVAAALPVKVPLLVTIDPNWFPEPPVVPNNVRVVLNYYQDFDVLGRALLTPGFGFAGELIQTRRPEAHIVIDSSPVIHAEIIRRVRAIAAGLGVRLPLPPPQRLPATGDGSRD
jgi:pimeloyl-ACP methyl ester carboxylesterase